MLDETCEVCGQQAVLVVRDLREGTPQRTDDGQLWATWEGVGDPHFLCALHGRKPTVQLLPGGRLPPDQAYLDDRAKVMEELGLRYDIL